MKKQMTENQKLELIKSRLSSAMSGRNSNSWASANCWDYLWRTSANYNVKAIDDTTRLRANLPMVYIENLCGICMDANIDMLVYAQKPNMDLDAHIYQAIVKWVQTNNNDVEVRDQLHKFAMLGGTSIIKASVEDTKSGKFIKYVAVDPKFVRVDPMATSNDNIRWLIQMCQYTKDELKEIFPKFNEKISHDFENDVNDEVEVWNQSEGSEDTEMIRVAEQYDVQNGTRTICTGGQILEEDTDSMKCGLPYVLIGFITAPDRIFGKDLYSELRDMFDEWSKNMKRMADIIGKNAVGSIAISSQYIKPNQITNEDNAIYILNCPDVRMAIQQLPAPPMNAAPLEFAKQMEYYLSMIAGVNDVTTGSGPVDASTPSGVSIEKLQQAAQTRVRSYITRLRDIGYTKLSNLIIRMAHEYLTTEEVIRITGSDTDTVMKVWQADKTNAVKILAQSGAKDKEEIAQGMQIYEMEKGIKITRQGSNAYLTFIGSLLGDPTLFGVRGEGGVDTAHKKVDIANQALMLAQMGKIDDQTLFEALDFPMKEKAIERSPMMQQFKAWMAEQQKQAQMQQQVQDSVDKTKMKEQITQKEAQSVQPNQGGFAGAGVTPNDIPQQLNSDRK